MKLLTSTIQTIVALATIAWLGGLIELYLGGAGVQATIRHSVFVDLTYSSHYSAKGGKGMRRALGKSTGTRNSSSSSRARNPQTKRLSVFSRPHRTTQPQQPGAQQQHPTPQGPARTPSAPPQQFPSAPPQHPRTDPVPAPQPPPPAYEYTTLYSPQQSQTSFSGQPHVNALQPAHSSELSIASTAPALPPQTPSLTEATRGPSLARTAITAAAGAAVGSMVGNAMSNMLLKKKEAPVSSSSTSIPSPSEAPVGSVDTNTPASSEALIGFTSTSTPSSTEAPVSSISTASSSLSKAPTGSTSTSNPSPSEPAGGLSTDLEEQIDFTSASDPPASNPVGNLSSDLVATIGSTSTSNPSPSGPAAVLDNDSEPPKASISTSNPTPLNSVEGLSTNTNSASASSPLPLDPAGSLRADSETPVDSTSTSNLSLSTATIGFTTTSTSSPSDSAGSSSTDSSGSAGLPMNKLPVSRRATVRLVFPGIGREEVQSCSEESKCFGNIVKNAVVRSLNVSADRVMLQDVSFFLNTSQEAPKTVVTLSLLSDEGQVLAGPSTEEMAGEIRRQLLQDNSSLLRDLRLAVPKLKDIDVIETEVLAGAEPRGGTTSGAKSAVNHEVVYLFAASILVALSHWAIT